MASIPQNKIILFVQLHINNYLADLKWQIRATAFYISPFMLWVLHIFSVMLISCLKMLKFHVTAIAFARKYKIFMKAYLSFLKKEDKKIKFFFSGLLLTNAAETMTQAKMPVTSSYTK